MRIDVITILPEMLDPVLDASIVGRARTSGALFTPREAFRPGDLPTLHIER